MLHSACAWSRNIHRSFVTADAILHSACAWNRNIYRSFVTADAILHSACSWNRYKQILATELYFIGLIFDVDREVTLSADATVTNVTRYQVSYITEFV
jgi:hypothetical protein